MHPIIERVFNGIVRVDKNLAIKFISDTGLRWFGGITPSIPNSFLDLVYEEDRDNLLDAIKCNNGKNFNCYVRLIRSKGNPAWATLRATVMPVVSQYLICILDISDYKNLHFHVS